MLNTDFPFVNGSRAETLLSYLSEQGLSIPEKPPHDTFSIKKYSLSYRSLNLDIKYIAQPVTVPPENRDKVLSIVYFSGDAASIDALLHNSSCMSPVPSER